MLVSGSRVATTFHQDLMLERNILGDEYAEIELSNLSSIKKTTPNLVASNNELKLILLS